MGLKMINQNLRIGHFFKDVGSDSIDFEFYEVSKLTDKRVYYIYETKVVIWTLISYLKQLVILEQKRFTIIFYMML